MYFSCSNSLISNKIKELLESKFISVNLINQYIMKRVLFFIFQYFTIFILSAQSLEQVIAPILNSKNISYTDLILHKDLFSERLFRDTILAQFDYSSEDTLVKIRTGRYETWKDANKLVLIDNMERTYRLKNSQEFSGSIYNSFVERLNRLLKDMPQSRIILPIKDSIVNGIPYDLYQYVSLDSVENGKRIYHSEKILVDKMNHLPVYLRTDSEGYLDGTQTHINFFEEHWIKDLKLNDLSFEDISKIQIPEHIKLEAPIKRLPLLENSTVSPILNFINEQGDLTNLSNHKGKMVLLNITWVGCPHCMSSITMLNEIYDKYKKDGLEIISVYPLDKEDEVLSMNTDFDVRYSFVRNTENTVTDLEKFNVSGYPTFYLIDKNGKIIKGWPGYSGNIANEIFELILLNLKR